MKCFVYTGAGYGDELFSKEDESFEAEAVFYKYHAESYEGWGESLWKMKDGTWRRSQISHCSCNDPVEDAHGEVTDKFVDKLKDIYGFVTEDCYLDLLPLITMAREEGYE